jgi:hypothetical protein
MDRDNIFSELREAIQEKEFASIAEETKGNGVKT